MNGEEGRRSGFWRFWTSLPGVLTGLAGVLGAVGTIAALMLGGGGDANGHQTSSSAGASTTATTPTQTATVPSQHAWQHELNAICREEGRNAQAREAAQEAKPGEVAKKEIQETAWLSMNRRLRAQTSPPEDELKLLRMTGAWNNAAEEIHFEIVAEQESSKLKLEAAEKRYNEDNEAGNGIAYELGLDICAHEPS
jgi:hypothetical protein